MQYYNSDQMKLFRTQLLNGEKPDYCSTCYYEESFGKINGRIRQLNKSAIDVNNFNLTIRSSPHYKNFEYSLNNNGQADMAPVDLQIELGNTCNSACIMCVPEASSRLEQEYHKLHKINSSLFVKPKTYKSWTKDENLVKKFVQEIISIPKLRYIHFLGGETLYDESFYTICDQLVAHGIAKDIIVGTTTNGTIFNNRIQKFIENFKQFHLGISIESVTPLNDYVRWPGKIDSILPNIDKFLQLREANPGLFISLRITPNIFSIYDIDKLFVYMIENHVIAESCNILNNPQHLRMELMPNDIRNEVKEKLEKLIDYYELKKENIANIRRKDKIDQVTANVILDYYQFVSNYDVPDDVENLRRNLIDFIKSFESLRGNSILDCAPRYEKFLRNYGY
jgi:sulfatase maturation enzyme AslB (radical SAM superfamily)